MHSNIYFKDIFDKALNEGRFMPVYQPIISMEDSKTVGFEILSRWYNEDGSALSPEFFISEAEYNNCLDYLTNKLLNQAFNDMQSKLDNQFLSLNISPTQLKSNNICSSINKSAKK